MADRESTVRYYRRRARRERADLDRWQTLIDTPLVLSLPDDIVAPGRGRLAVSRSNAVSEGDVTVGGVTTPDLDADEIHVFDEVSIPDASISIANSGGGTLSIYVTDEWRRAHLIATAT